MIKTIVTGEKLPTEYVKKLRNLLSIWALVATGRKIMKKFKGLFFPDIKDCKGTAKGRQAAACCYLGMSAYCESIPCSSCGYYTMHLETFIEFEKEEKS